MFHALESLQIGVGLSGPYAEAEGELTDECHRESDDVSFFASHNLYCNNIVRCYFAVLCAAKIIYFFLIAKDFVIFSIS